MSGWTERLGRILAGGFGPEVVQGLIAGYLDRISSEQCRRYIRDNKSLTEKTTEKQWELLRKTAQASKMKLCYEEVLNQVKTNRPDLLGIIVTTDGGVVWFKRQVEEVQKKLT